MRRQQWIAQLQATELMALVADAVASAMGDVQPSHSKTARGSLQQLLNALGQ